MGDEKQKIIFDETQAILSMRERPTEEPEIIIPMKEPMKTQRTPKRIKSIHVICIVMLILNVVIIGSLLQSNHSLKKENQGLKESVVSVTNQNNQLIEMLNQFKIEYQQSLTQTSNLYLTFDDGPTHQTEAILDILKQYNVKATFFVLGDKQPGLYQRIINEGHQLALHSNTHQYQQIYASVDDFFSDLYALQTQLKNITGLNIKIFRFPGGSSNTIASSEVMDGIIQRATQEGFIYFDWNCDSYDSSGTQVSVETIVQQSIKCDINQNIVLLLHDSKDKQATVDALSSIISHYQVKNYVFRTLNSLTPLVQHKKSN